MKEKGVQIPAPELLNGEAQFRTRTSEVDSLFMVHIALNTYSHYDWL